MTQHAPLAPFLWALVAAALFGASTPAAKALVGGLGPLSLGGLLYLGAALAVSPWALAGRRRRRTLKADRKNRSLLLGAVVLGGGLGPVLLLFGLSLAPAASVALWLNLETVATALLARWVFREHLHAPAWLAVVLIILASALLAPTASGGSVALLLVALACFAWGVDNNLTSIIDRYAPAEITFAKGVGAGAVNLALGALTSAPLTPSAAFAAVGIGALSYGVSLLLYIASAQQLGAARSQLVFSTAPLWGIALAWLALREPMLSSQLAAAALIALALWLLYRERHEHEHGHQELTHTHHHRHDDGHHDHKHAEAVMPGVWHTHEHKHSPVTHSHPHQPDMHHRHEH